jgi:glucosamine-6-phosphate deaminase
MQLVAAHFPDEFAEVAAGEIANRVRDNPRLVLTMPTGATPIGLYRRLVHEHAHGRFSLEHATVFMLDEYIDLPTYPGGSFIEFLGQHLGPVLFDSATTFYPMTNSPEVSYASSYDAALDDAGGLDLAVVGVGANGHVGFNEPGDDPAARTHVVTLTRDTLDANFPHSPIEARPTQALTVGLADLRRSRSVLMLVAGARKREIVQLLRKGRVLPGVPATQLLDHDQLTVVVDDTLL